VCDAAKSMQNAFTEVFGNAATVRMCWAHAKMKIQTRVENIKNKQIQKSVLLDIDDLHSTGCPKIGGTTQWGNVNSC
jgi:transposase-like protein